MYCPFPSKTIFSGKILPQLSCIFWWIVDTFSKIFRQNPYVGHKKTQAKHLYAPPVAFFFLKLQFRSAL